MTSNCLVSQSGGPTAVINNSLVGLLDEMEEQQFIGKVYGSLGGLHGLISEDFVELSTLSFKKRIQLRSTPGAALGTCRHKLTEDEAEQIITVLKKYNIRYFFYIGGNGSMQIARMIEEAASILGYSLVVIGIPKSIDNDLLETDHSPGYGSAAKFLTTSLLEMQMDAASYPNNSRVTIIETMGRHTGWLAGACALARNEEHSQTMIYIPEIPFNLDDCIGKVIETHKENRNSFLIVSEGIVNADGTLVNKEIGELEYDPLNRAKLGGVTTHLQEQIENQTGIQTRSITPSIWQRSSILLSSKTDAEEAYEAGRTAWKLAIKGYTGIMVGIDRINSANEDYRIEFNPKMLIDVANKEKHIPIAWYDQEKHTMQEEFLQYIRPLIQGEVQIPMENGLPLYEVIL
ncbi:MULTISPECIES: diphosphate--fructose-6-phosphate 1-phosphotransferase [unclassified Sporosarcina]|uniref:diphosphate--fructose-6-phosphate 1-phosphotransferase n=1 Tax=unclassified Sporosarcina TaxID=2647733 RepID=UPI00203D5B1A|nr:MULTISPECIES: diphosphate--fructose-6-phosphate 1-phosphotransferase [unclassified Sporosarcina]GKV65864.1 pyrophosphate--fructose 6-phosphate 1-phosphotransferase [Sporosarcina sp. NCCP-2331]GLB55989.1 pyrophosphate--fructose 6-phosphate 1-phosphotransferase [Sporosarcina sp. NCCP-2378]